MKQVLLSIKPKYCELIASGQKTIEIRKTRPICQTPFKVYIYCTKDEPLYHSGEKFYMKEANEFGNGKVIGEFVCDKITEFEGEFWDDETQEIVKEIIHKTDWDGYPETEMRCVAENGEKNYLCDRSCLTWEELRSYIGQGDSTFYGWHISNLVIYDAPQKISEFWEADKCPHNYNGACMHRGHCARAGMLKRCGGRITKAPQSWRYVER